MWLACYEVFRFVLVYLIMFIISFGDEVKLEGEIRYFLRRLIVILKVFEKILVCYEWFGKIIFWRYFM